MELVLINIAAPAALIGMCETMRLLQDKPAKRAPHPADDVKAERRYIRREMVAAFHVLAFIVVVLGCVTRFAS
jgi:hypothetical protein